MHPQVYDCMLLPSHPYFAFCAVITQQLMSIAKLIYPDALISGGMTDECRETLERVNLNSRRRLEGEGDSVSDLFGLTVEFPDGSSIDDSGTSGSTSGSPSISMYEMIKKIYLNSIGSTVPAVTPNSNGQNDASTTSVTASWYVNWVSTCK